MLTATVEAAQAELGPCALAKQVGIHVPQRDLGAGGDQPLGEGESRCPARRR